MSDSSKPKRKPPAATIEPGVDPQSLAKAARLTYSSDSEPGIRRRRAGKRFIYVGPDGRRITDQATLERIQHLVIPPMWRNVWICADDKGHIQVTARDQRGRKQYRYHANWMEATGETKFARMLLFVEKLPELRRKLDADLRLKGLPREKVLATVVALLGSTFIRVGNDEYAQHNETYGLTTLQDKHVSVEGDGIHFEFRGKSGKEHAIDLRDPRLARIIQRSKDIPGKRLFQYVDEQSQSHAVTASDVNAYLKELTGEAFTAKDFRTWGGTLLAVESLACMPPVENERQLKRNLTAMYKAVSEQLGNTVATCKKYYVHPMVVALYEAGKLPAWLAKHGVTSNSQTAGAGIEQALLHLPPRV